MEALQLPQDLYWGTKTEPLSPPSDDQLFPSLFSPTKIESDDDAEDVLLDAETNELITNVLMDGEILLHLQICDNTKGQWDCIQGGNYLAQQFTPQIIQQPNIEFTESTSEFEESEITEIADILELLPKNFILDNTNYDNGRCPLVYQIQHRPNVVEQPQQLKQILPQPQELQQQLEQHLQQQHIQQQQQPQHQQLDLQQHQQFPEQEKLDYATFYCDLNSATCQTTKEEILRSPISPTSSSSSSPSIIPDETSESERGDEIVDEILRIHTKNLPDFSIDDNDSLYSSSEFSTVSDTDSGSYKVNSVNSMSPISNHDYPLKITSSDENFSSQENLQQINNLSNDDFMEISGQAMKKRSRLYVRNLDEKKSRKKEQNKNAATRYRQKKKIEMKQDLDEERVLLEKNSSLKKYVDDYQREIKYLKKLIKEFHKNDQK